MTTTITIDPEFRDLIPPLEPEELAELEASLLAEGCRDPLALWGEILLDGHHRHRLCTEHGIRFETYPVLGIESRADAVLWMGRNQLGRRNAGPFVRGTLALRMKAAAAENAKARQGTRTDLGADLPQGGGRVRDALAAEAGISARNLSKIERVLADGVPDLVERCRAGDVSINLGERIARRAPRFQRAALSSDDPAVALDAFDGRLVLEPRLRDALPEHRESELAMLGATLLDHGVVEPLLVWGRTLVDGFARYGFCLEHGLPFTVREVRGRPIADLDDAIRVRHQIQLTRKNLTPEEVAVMLVAAESVKRDRSAGEPPAELILDDGVLAALPPISFERAQAIEADLVEHGCREPLTVWQGPDGPVLIDGLARYVACRRHSIGFATRNAERVDSIESAGAHRASLPIIEAGLPIADEARAHAKAVHFLAAHARHPFARTDDDGTTWRMSPEGQRRRVRWLLDEYDAARAVEIA